MSFSHKPHIVLFPFMSKGHTIPLLHLARLLYHHQVTVTIFTTPANLPFISHFLVDLPSISFVTLPFSSPLPGIESTDELPSMSIFFAFASSTSSLQPLFEKSLSELIPKPTFLVSDGFLGWTLGSASRFGIPRLVYYGMSNQAMTIYHVMKHNVNNFHLLEKAGSDKELFRVSEFPWVELSRSDFEPCFLSREPNEPSRDFFLDNLVATSNSCGLLTNSFYSLESHYVDYWNSFIRPKSWCIGPLCLAEPVRLESQLNETPSWIQWLDKKHEQRHSVLYVAFGSQTEISQDQLKEIEIGLQKSEVNFLWVLRKNNSRLSEGFEERMSDMGLIVRDWVDQRAILEHKCVQGFLSHCGWNSVMESISAKVPILAWPMMAEQPLNARMVVEELKVGIQVNTHDSSVRGFVKSEGLTKAVRELMEEETGKEVLKKVNEVGVEAVSAMAEGGSSWLTLNQLIDEMCAM